MEQKSFSKKIRNFLVSGGVIISGILLLRKNNAHSKSSSKNWKQNITFKILKTQWGRKFLWKFLKKRWGRRFIIYMTWENMKDKGRNFYKKVFFWGRK